VGASALARIGGAVLVLAGGLLTILGLIALARRTSGAVH
jgi:hypothetical protein